MSDRKIENHNIRKLKRTGKGNNGSFAITLPIELIRELGWREKQKLVVEKKGGSLTIKDWHN